jgi:histidinol phosphatase-like PHP family hydrolase
VEALVARAAARGLTLAITDHLSIDQKMNSAERLSAYIDALEEHPVYRGVEVDIGEEIAIPAESRARLDYVIGSVHNVTTSPGKRYMVTQGSAGQGSREWQGIPRATTQGAVPPRSVEDPGPYDDYMEYYVAALVRGLTSGTFNFVGHPTFLVGLPPQTETQHDALWTAPRRRAVIEAALAGGVAFEISTRYRVPSPTFMREAVDAGMTFVVGSDSHWIDRIGEFSLPLRYIEEFSLAPDRFFLPARTIDG